jgi:CRP-like cAMP-binding protein
MDIIFLMAVKKHSPLEIKTAEAHTCTVAVRLRILKALPFFQGLPPGDFDWINSLFHEKDFKVDEVICLSGEPAERLFVVADGRVRLLQHSLTGKDILLDLLTPGEFFGALSGLGNEVYPDTAQAHSPCCILVISREAFQQILTRHPVVALKVIYIMAKRLELANQRVHQLSDLTVEARIASLLLRLSAKFGKRHKVGTLLQVPLSRDDLAGMAGTTTESASRAMSRFQKAGLIRAGRGWVAVTDRPGLEAIAGKELQ